MRVAILTISTSFINGQRTEDASGNLLAELIQRPPLSAQVAARTAVQDDKERIAAILKLWCDSGAADVILTTGGTGFAQDDCAPEAARAVFEKEAPGIAEALRAETAAKTPLAWLSRAAAGIRGKTIIINLPGSPKAVQECYSVLEKLLPHAVAILTGEIHQH